MVDSEKKRVETMRDAAQAELSIITSIFETLKSNVRDLYMEVGSTSSVSVMVARQYISDAATSAKTTGLVRRVSA